MTNLKKTQVYFDRLKSFPKNADCANIMESTEYGIWHSILPEEVEEFGFQVEHGFQVEQRGDRSSPTEYK